MLKSSSLHMFEFLKNEIDFFIRSKTKFSRKNFVEKSERILKIVEQENDYVYEILDKFFIKNKFNYVKILDIGSKNWSYARGQHSFFSSFCHNFLLDGVEVDAYRLYPNLYSRFEAAKFYTRGLDNTNYICANLLDINQKYDYITWFLPFVSDYPLKKWGLPKRLFCPEKLLAYAYNLLEDDGQMLIINQGEKEYKIQKILLEELHIAYIDLAEIKSKNYPYSQKRYGFFIKKNMK